MDKYTIRKILNIPEYKVAQIISQNEQEIHVQLESYKLKKFICPGCGRVHKSGYHGVRESIVRDKPISELRVYLHVPKRRYRCPEDGRIRTEKIDWLKKYSRVTIRFAEQVNRLTAITTDGARSCISSSKRHATNALIVYDKFHLVQKLNQAVDTVRKLELRKARENKDQELVGLMNCRQRFILLKNKSNLTEKQTSYLQALCEINEPIYRAMLLKESFLQIYSYHKEEDVRAHLEGWIKEATSSSLQVFRALAQSFSEKMQYIINWFKIKISSAISEGFNNKIKRLKRMAYGYKDIDYFMLKIHQHCGLLNPRRAT